VCEDSFPSRAVVLLVKELLVSSGAELQLHDKVAADVIAPTADQTEAATAAVRTMSLHACTLGFKKPLGLWRPERLGWRLTKIKLEHPENNVQLGGAAQRSTTRFVMGAKQTRTALIAANHGQRRDHIMSGARRTAGRDMSNLVPFNGWFEVKSGRAIDNAPAALAKNRVILLGEQHDNPEHHRWQLETLTALVRLRPDLVLGFEAFPRRVQPSLDRWSRDELSSTAFLRDVEWSRIWGFDAELYLPLFEFARANHLPMVALNVDRETNRRAAAGESDKNALEGVGQPAPASLAYRERLLGWFNRHPMSAASAGFDAARFERFVRAQLFWDRAMAEAIARAVNNASSLLVGIIGAGHIEYGDGVPRQLAAMDVRGVVTALPWAARSCAPETEPPIADYLFGVQ
jgi:uncharacterized iron-regulated protein